MTGSAWQILKNYGFLWQHISDFPQLNVLPIPVKGKLSYVSYNQVVNNLTYLMVCTRPDIVLAIDKMRWYISNLWKFHWESMKWIFKYLKRTKDYGLLFDDLLDNAKFLSGSADVDYTQNLNQINLHLSMCLYLMIKALVRDLP